MKKLSILAIGALMLCTNAFAFEHKEISKFKTLDQFKTATEFEDYYNKYTQECLDNSGGGGMSADCFVSIELWDKDLNIQYKKLMSKLEPKEKEILKKSQKKWIESRDSDIEFNKLMMNRNSDEMQGTMFIGMAAGDIDAIRHPKIKERALLLKKWYVKATSESLLEGME